MASNFQTVIEVLYDLSKSDKQLQSKLKSIEKEHKIEIDAKINDSSISKLSEKMDIVRTRAEAMNTSFIRYSETLKSSELKKNASDINKISQSYENAAKSGKQIDLSKANASASLFKSEMKAAGAETKTFMQTLGNDISKFAQWTISATALMSGINAVKNVISTVITMDQNITDLRMATGLNNEETQKLMDTYIDLGQEMGATGSEVANAASSWLRQGKSMADTNTLIKDSMILSKVGQIDSAEATKYLTSAMKGYKLQASDVLGIIDKLSAIDISSATDVSGLAEAMSRVSNTANIAGVDMDKLLSYLATVGEVTQKDMSSIGEAFQTMFSRMGNIKLGKLVDTESGDSLNDVEGVLKTLGINLRDSKDSFRDFGDVLDDIGSRWGTYSEVERNALGVAISGTRQRENFTTLMENYGKSLEYAGISAASSGTAMEKFSIYQESVADKTKKISDSFEKLSKSLLDSSLVKGFLDVTNTVVKFTAESKLLNIALLTLGTVGLVKAIQGIIGWATGISSLIVQEIALTGATGALSTATTIFNTVMAMNPVFATVAALTALVGVIFGATQIFDHFNVSLDEHKQNLEKLKSEYDTSTSNVKSLEGQLATCKKQLEELNSVGGTKLANDEEKKKLEAQTEELKTQLAIANEIKRVAGLKAEQEATKTLSTAVVSKYQTESSKNSYGDTVVAPVNVTIDTELKNAMDAYDGYSKKVKEAQEAQSKLKADTPEWAEQDTVIKENSKSMEEARAYAAGLAGDLQKERTSLIGATDEGNKWGKTIDNSLPTYTNWSKGLDGVSSSAEQTSTATKKANESIKQSFSSAFNDSTFSDAKQKLLELSSSGKLSAETFSSTEEYKKLLTETGLTAEQTVDKINKLNTSNLSSNIGELESALSKVKGKQALSGEELSSLISKYPQLAGEIKKTNGAYTLEKDSLVSLLNTNKESYNVIIANDMAITNQKIEDTKAKIKADQAEIDSLKNVVKAYSIVLNARQEEAKSITGEDAQDADRAYNGNADSTYKQGVVSKYDDTIKDLEKSKNKYKKLTNEFKELEGNLKNISSAKDKTKDSTKDKTKTSYTSFIEDWIERKIPILTSKLDKFKTALSNATTIKGVDNNFNKAQSAIDSLSKTYDKSITKYQKKANGIDLSPEYKDKIKNGAIDIDTIKGSKNSEKLKTKIENYQKWIDKVNDTKKSLADLNAQEVDLQKSRVDKITENYNDKITKSTSVKSINSNFNKSQTDTGKLESGYNSDINSNTKKLNAIKFSKTDRTIRDKVLSGKIDLDNVKDSKLKKKIKSYQELQNKIDGSKTSLNYLKEKEEELLKLPADKIADFYNKKQNNIQGNITDINNAIDKKGFANEGDYNNLNAQENANITSNKQENIVLENAKTKALQGLTEGTYAYNLVNDYYTDKISEANVAIVESTKNINNNIKAVEELNTRLLALATTEAKTNKDYADNIMSFKESQGYKLTKDDYDYQIKANNGAIKANEDEINGKDGNKGLYARMKQAEKVGDYELAKNLKNEMDSKTMENISLFEENINLQNESANIGLKQLDTDKKIADAYKSMNQSMIELKRERGQAITTEDYTKAFEDIKKQADILNDDFDIYQFNYEQAIKHSGTYLGKSADDWNELMLNTKTGINNIGVEQEKLQDSMRDEVIYKGFKKAADAIEEMENKLKGLNDLLSDSSLYDIDGNLTKYGKAKIANTLELLKQGYADAKNAEDAYNKISKSDFTKDGVFNEEKYNKAKNDGLANYMSKLKDSEAIKDELVKLGFNNRQKEIDQIKKLAQTHIEAYNKQKAYYDYKKQIEDKTKSVKKLMMALQALNGVEGQEANAQRKNLQDQLDTANTDLTDTKFQHEVELVTDGLTDFTDGMQDNLDKQESLINTDSVAREKFIADLYKYYGLNNETSKTNDDAVINAGGTTDASGRDINEKRKEITSLSNKLEELKYNYYYAQKRGDSQHALSAMQFEINQTETALKNLKGAANGGVVRKSSNSLLSDKIASNGDTVLASFNPDETVLTKKFTDIMPLAVNAMQDFISLPKMNLPTISQASQPIIIQMDSGITIKGDVIENTMPDLTKFKKEIFNELGKNVTSQLVKNGYK